MVVSIVGVTSADVKDGLFAAVGVDQDNILLESETHRRDPVLGCTIE